MNEPARDTMASALTASGSHMRYRIVVVCSERDYAESLRSHLAAGFDVLMARNAGEAAAKALAVRVDAVIVDLGAPILGIPALSRMREMPTPPVICALSSVEGNVTQTAFDFDYVLARPKTGLDLPDRIRFVLAKTGNREVQAS